MRALITGITGQDGYFLSKLLLDKQYDVYGIARRKSDMSLGALEYDESLKKDVHIIWGDVTDAEFIEKTVAVIRPDELYHLAAQSSVALSFENPSYTYDVNIKGTLNVLNAVRDTSRGTRVYNAATSELFGKPDTVPQNENTPMRPRSPYAISKLAAYWTARDYREAYGMFIANGILFNHESEVRGPEFVTRKITLGIANIFAGKQDYIELGNLEAKKDWGYAGDYVRAMWKMVRHDVPDDFVIGTGEMHTVREFVEKAFSLAVKKLKKNLQFRWVGNEGYLNDRMVVTVSKKYYRPLEADNYMADYSKAKDVLGWEPFVRFADLVDIMVTADLMR